MVRPIDVNAASHLDQAGSQDPRPHAKIMPESPAEGEEMAPATGGDGLFGATLAGEAGRNLDRSDLLYLALATKRSLEATSSEQAANWCNPDTGSYGKVVLYNEDVTAEGQVFRHVMQTITAGGQTWQTYATAFRQADGTWKLVH